MDAIPPSCRGVYQTLHPKATGLQKTITGPVYAIAVSYSVGWKDERPGRTRFAHLFGHMMFTGSERVGAGPTSLSGAAKPELNVQIGSRLPDVLRCLLPACSALQC